jgi:hypothetical protein
MTSLRISSISVKQVLFGFSLFDVIGLSEPVKSIYHENPRGERAVDTILLNETMSEIYLYLLEVLNVGSDEVRKMLSSMMSTMSATSTLNVLSTTSATSLFAPLGVSDVSIIAVVCLIGLLAAYEILSASKLWNKRLSTMLNLAIIPMVMAFIAIVGYKVVAIIAH